MEADLSGQKIGEYEVIGPLGRGGMGMVYEGRQPMIGKRVAIKVLLREFSGQKDVVDRFTAEARAVNAIRHRGIVDIFSFGQLEDGTHFCVMEFLEGAPFDELIRTRAPVSPGDALRWTDEVLDALDAAHKAGVIHRDIKPSNLFLVDTGHGRPYVKLLDFGIAKLSPFKGGPSVGEASAVVGTPDYMAPEQARAKQISGATDLYAVGCVLFELLTRERVFEGMSAVDMMFAHVQKAPRAPSTLERGITREVDAFVLKLLAKAPEDRPKTSLAAREELHLLLRKLNEAPTLPPPSSYTGRHEKVDKLPGPPLSATPRPGWNEDDRGAGQTWMSGSSPGGDSNKATPEARTQLSAAVVPEDGPTNESIPIQVPAEQPLVAPRNNGPLFALLAGVAVLSSIGGWLVFSRDLPPPPPIETPIVVRPVVVEPLPVVVQPPPVVEPPPVEPVVVAPPVVPPVAEVPDAGARIRPSRPSGPTQQALQQRLKKLVTELERLEEAKGKQTAVRMLLPSVQEQVKKAKTPADLKAASAALDEFQSNFPQ